MIRTKFIILVIVYASITFLCGCINYTSTSEKVVETTGLDVGITDKKTERQSVSISGYVDFRSEKRPLQKKENIVEVKEDSLKGKKLNENNLYTSTSNERYHHLIQYIGYEVLYNSSTKIPVWVKYELTSEEVDGVYSRKGKDFRQDLNKNVAQADYSDYRGSGWSRGHMAPAADFKWNNEAMWETFYYTNCCPQNSSLNSGQWNTLEQKVRDWAKRYGCVIVITGPIIGNNEYGTIGSNKVTVPDAFYKAVSNGQQAIAFVMYNRSKNENLQKCAISIDSLEELIQIDLFTELDDEIEAQYSLKYWRL